MPRIRTIKPEFWTNEALAGLSDRARLLAIALLNQCDDEGYFLANASLVRSSCFPFDDDSTNVRRSLEELSSIGYIEVRECAGKTIGRVVKFIEHQRIDRPQKSKLSLVFVEFTNKSAISTNDRRMIDEQSQTYPRLEQGKERNREQGKEQGSGECEGEQDADKPRSSASADKQVPLLHREILDSWNSAMNRNDRMTPKRVAALRQRLKDSIWVESWAEAIRRASESPFCLGDNDQGWLAHFEWFIRPDTVTNILEGKYDHREPKKVEPEFVF